jgi:hypothetical protein
MRLVSGLCFSGRLPGFGVEPLPAPPGKFFIQFVSKSGRQPQLLLADGQAGKTQAPELNKI